MYINNIKPTMAAASTSASITTYKKRNFQNEIEHVHAYIDIVIAIKNALHRAIYINVRAL